MQVYFDNLLLRKLQFFFVEIIVILIGIKYSRIEYLLILEKMYGEGEFYLKIFLVYF